MGTANGEDMDNASDDDEDEDYAAGDQDGDESEDVEEEDEDGPHDHDYEDTGSIVSEPSKHGDDDATNMGDIDVDTEMEVSSGQSPDGCGAGTGETPDVVDVKKRDNNHIESEGVDGPNTESEGVDEQNNDVMHHDGDEMEHVEERTDNQSSDDQSLDGVETSDDTDDKMGYNLRRNRERSYKHIYDPNVFNIEKGSDDRGGIMMTTTNGGSEETGQMSMRKGLKVFGEPGYAAVKKEMQQLHDRKVMQPVDRKDLSQSQKKEAQG